PSAYGPKWDQLRDLFDEAHGLVNEYRPHQARESLIRLMEAQIARSKGETEAVREVGGQVRDVLDGLKGLGEKEVGVGGKRGGVEAEEGGQEGMEKQGGEARRRRFELKRVWEVVEEEVGEF
ncbi:MAG: hypothetical protein Q9214_005649, partial [Letrouitia sp. 1 TL-2023]